MCLCRTSSDNHSSRKGERSVTTCTELQNEEGVIHLLLCPFGGGSLLVLLNDFISPMLPLPLSLFLSLLLLFFVFFCTFVFCDFSFLLCSAVFVFTVQYFSPTFFLRALFCWTFACVSDARAHFSSLCGNTRVVVT